MSATKTCSTCGAENDGISTNCLFCKTSLPRIDLNSLSNEELVLNAGEWVGKARQHDYVISKNDYNANVWTGKGIHKIKVNNADMVGNAERYLSLLQIRAISNANLLPLYENLRRQLEENKAFAVKNNPSTQAVEKSGRIFLILFIVITIGSIIMGYLSNH